MLRPVLRLGIVMVVGVVAAAAAHAEVSGNLAVTSDYVSRGVSYSDNHPAVQGELVYSHPSGVYVSAWGSRVDFGTPAHVELDVYGGITRPMFEGFAWDLGVAYYSYPGDSATNYHEVYVGLTRRLMTARLWYTCDYFGTGGSEQYWEGEFTWALSHAVGLALHAGYSVFEPMVGITNYADYRASLSREYRSFTFDLSYTGTNTDQFGSWDDGRVVATVSKPF